MQFQKEIEIAVPVEKVWNFIWDVDRFIACVPGCREAKTLEAGKRYSARCWSATNFVVSRPGRPARTIKSAAE